jgi:hypothetical protein
VAVQNSRNLASRHSKQWRNLALQKSLFPEGKDLFYVRVAQLCSPVIFASLGRDL